jgi:hypothetical protein
MYKHISIIATSLVLATASYAEPLKERGGYIGAAYGATSFEDDGFYDSYNDGFDVINLDLDEDGQAWQIYGGYRFMKYFAVEGRYTGFGDYKANADGFLSGIGNFSGEDKIEFSSLTAHALGIYPFGQSGFDIYGQLGLGTMVYDRKTTVSIAQGSGSVKDDDSSLTLSAGVGVRYTPPKFQHLTVQLAYDTYAFQVEDEFDEEYNMNLSMAKLGVQYNF